MRIIRWLAAVFTLGLAVASVIHGYRTGNTFMFVLAVLLVLIAAGVAYNLITERKNGTHEALPATADRPPHGWLPDVSPEGHEDEHRRGRSDAEEDHDDLRLHDAGVLRGHLLRDPLPGLTYATGRRRQLTLRDNEIYWLRDALRQLDGYATTLTAAADEDTRRIGRTISSVTRPIIGAKR